MNRREYLLSAASALVLAAASGARAVTGEGKAVYSPQIIYRIRIPMRDGVHLGATLYLPRGLDTPRSTIFSHMPYTADLYHPEGAYFSTRAIPILRSTCAAVAIRRASSRHSAAR